ncbi:hypothetical protein [Arcobacter sp. FWKO B]|uniref:hypothetical protein n=1 Tax=Arcobacter sp. FWKO B TaxID=2593672 RepID=UPI0018A531D6|nr:hypothetical protein [Arcobacter sp. FWKO B]QOG12691.1 hypothetical protein FWKOB_08255 [Arcobacter sp. FWKO B]
MQTITLQIEDDFLPKFMNVLEVMPKNKIKIQKDAITLELEKRIQEIEDGSLPAVPFDTMWDNIEQKIEKYKNEN